MAYSDNSTIVTKKFVSLIILFILKCSKFKNLEQRACVSIHIVFWYPKQRGVMGLKLVQMAEYQGPLYKVKYQFMQPTFIGTRSCG
jgi:hypothetical protein